MPACLSVMSERFVPTGSSPLHSVICLSTTSGSFCSAIVIVSRLGRCGELAKPYAVAGLNVYGADSDEEAELIASSQQQFTVELFAGRPGELQPPVAAYRDCVGSQGAATIEQVLGCAIAAGPAKIAAGLADFAERTKADEIMVSSATYDHRARRRSLEITAQAASQSIVKRR